MYAHLRTTASCNKKAMADGIDLESGRPQRTQKTILLVGYGRSGGERAADIIHAALDQLDGPVAKGSKMTRAMDWDYRASPLLRHMTPAVEDVFVYGSQAPMNVSLDSADGKAMWLAQLNAAVSAISDDDNVGIRIFDRQYVHRDLQALHAEKACSAREYVCLLPWAYLEDSPPPTDASEAEKCAIRLKTTLRLLMPQKSGEHGGFRHRRGEVQAGWRATRRWHNFARGGGAVPSDAAVGRVVDRFWARGSPVVWRAEADSTHGFVRLHVSADALLDGQLERMVGAAVCMHRSLLPASFATAVLDPRVVLNVPPVPSGLTYLRRARLDWEARKQAILRRTRSDDVEQALVEYEDAMQRSIASSAAASDAEARCWVDEMASDVCPRILDAATRQGMPLAGWPSADHARAHVMVARGATVSPINKVPEAYSDVLRLLRAADQSGRWPSTSRARARVLTVDDESTGGSFSLRARGSAAASTWHGAETRGNAAFNELVDAVFALERAIAPDRPPSTMVAVNRRATFLPHTDAGSGFGQSTSLIVGLGAYTGGELIVEGEPHEICYQPLTFDGWRQRHWTLPFEGERFSLVWFTPAGEAGGPVASKTKSEHRYAARLSRD